MTRLLFILPIASALIAATTLMGCQTSQHQVGLDVEVMVGLQRTACFGRCPVYELSVLNTGEATLKVDRFCEEAFGRSLAQGTHSAQVEIEAWQVVTDLAASLGFDTLQSRYDNPMVTDLPANIITINGKTVFNRYGGPDLDDIYTQIQRLVGSTDWKADEGSAR